MEGMNGYRKLFEDASVSVLYAKHRPSMSSELVNKIMQFLVADDVLTAKSPKFDHAVDVGCGSGQSTRAFAPYFSKLTGIDVSSSQVAAAEQSETCKHISYRVGTAEALPFPAESVDLINTTQAAHWFDFAKFYAEADRVLKPGGLISVNCYRIPHLYSLTGDDNISAKLTDIMENLPLKTLRNYLVKDIESVRKFYDELVIPYDTNCAFRDDCELSVKFGEEDVVTIATIVSYVSSLTSYQNYLRKTPDTRLLLRIQNELLSIMGEDDPDVARVKVAFPVTLLMGKK